MMKHANHIIGSTDWMIPGHLNFGDFMLEKLWGFKGKTAMLDASTLKSTTYGEIVQQSMNFAVSLTHMGVRKGDVVGLISENREEFWGAVIGVACTGATLATICPIYVKEEFKNALNLSKPKYLICSPFAYKNHAETINSLALSEKFIIFGNERVHNTILYKDLAVDVNEQVRYEEFKSVDVDGQTDTLFIIYSSGTTGLPKGVMLTHLNVITSCSLRQVLLCGNASMTLYISPWYHSMGLVGFLSELVSGRTGVYMPQFNVHLYLKTIEKFKITDLILVPPVLKAVCMWPSTYDVSSVKLICSGAAPLHRATIQAAYQKFSNLEAVLQVYGASETTLGVITFRLEESEMAKRKPGSVGRVIPGMSIKVADTETRAALGPNQRGEICVKGAMLMKGYVGIGRGNDFDVEGFYKTGDVGYYDDERFFYVVDRLKELIKYKGFQVSPTKLEALLLTHSSVNDVGVIGIPHESGGEMPLAFVVVQPGSDVTERELQEYVAERVSEPEQLRGGVRFVDKIPKSPAGKILRKELRALLKAPASTGCNKRFSVGGN